MRLAGLEDRRASGAMNSAVHAATTQQRRVGGIHNGIGLLASNVGGTRDRQSPIVQGDSQ